MSFCLQCVEASDEADLAIPSDSSSAWVCVPQAVENVTRLTSGFCFKTDAPDLEVDNECTEVMRYAGCNGTLGAKCIEHGHTIAETEELFPECASCVEGPPYATWQALREGAQEMCMAASRFGCTYILQHELSPPSLAALENCTRLGYNASAAEPCGACSKQLFAFKTCEPEPLSFEFWVCGLYSFVGFELTFTIFSSLAEVLRGFEMRILAVRYLLELTPHHGVHTHLQQNHYGLLPSFDFDRVHNIVAWNRMRILLQTYDNDAFGREQKKATFILLGGFLLLLGQLLALLNLDDFLPTWDWLPERFQYVDAQASPKFWEALKIKVALSQLLGSGLVLKIFFTGSNTSHLHEYELPHMLALKKAELKTAGPYVQSLLFSTDVAITFWCKMSNEVDQDGQEDLRQYLERERLRDKIARISVRTTLGIPMMSSSKHIELNRVLN
eukprot:COSAG06_NODE_1796_length_8371_cov_58.788201_3_plen_443_part_00